MHYSDSSVMAELSSSWQSQHRDSDHSQLVILTSKCPASNNCPDSAPGADDHVSPLSHDGEPANPNYHFSCTASTRECIWKYVLRNWTIFILSLCCGIIRHFRCLMHVCVLFQLLLQPQFIKAESVLLTTLKPDPCIVTTVASPTSLATTTTPVQSTSLQVGTSDNNWKLWSSFCD